MIYRVLTELVIVLHFGFLLFVLAGGLLGRRSRWLMVPHLVAVAWAAYIETMPGLRCPLTVLENYLAFRAGGPGYEGGFIAHYLLPVIYPDGLTRQVQWVLAAAVLLINAWVYLWPHRRSLARPATP